MMYSPISRVRLRYFDLWSRVTFSVLMVSLPPRGMASRAFTARFMITCSIWPGSALDRKSTRLNSSHTVISYAVFCLKKKTDNLLDDLRHRFCAFACFGWRRPLHRFSGHFVLARQCSVSWIEERLYHYSPGSGRGWYGSRPERCFPSGRAADSGRPVWSAFILQRRVGSDPCESSGRCTTGRLRSRGCIRPTPVTG